MPYFVEIRLRPDYDSVPVDARNQHIAFLDKHIERVLAGGGLWNDDASKVRGGFYILEVEDRSQAERLVAQDPYIIHGIFDVVQITRWRKAYFDHQRFI